MCTPPAWSQGCSRRQVQPVGSSPPPPSCQWSERKIDMGTFREHTPQSTQGSPNRDSFRDGEDLGAFSHRPVQERVHCACPSSTGSSCPQRLGEDAAANEGLHLSFCTPQQCVLKTLEISLKLDYLLGISHMPVFFFSLLLWE